MPRPTVWTFSNIRRLGLCLGLWLVTPWALAVTPAVTHNAESQLLESPNGSVLVAIAANSRLQLIEIDGDWARVQFEASSGKTIEGWLPASDVEISGTSQLETNIGRAYVANTQDCAWHRPSSSKICVRTLQAQLECRKSYPGGPWKRCQVNLTTDVITNAPLGAPLTAGIECDVRIEYKGESSFRWLKQGQTQTFEQDLQASPSTTSIRSEHSFAYQFDAFEDINNVKIDKADCEITLPKVPRPPAKRYQG